MKTKNTETNPKQVQILLEWKKLYLHAILEFLKPTGNILEVGFDDGIAAEIIQKYKPKNYTIIASHAADAAKKWASQHHNITFITENWKNALPKLGKFDLIFYNDFSVEHDMALMNFLFPEATEQASDQIKDLLSKLEEQLVKLKQQFSDKEVEDFYNNIGKKNLNALPQFFDKLQKNGNITKAQHDKFTKKFHLDKAKEVKSKKTAPAMNSYDPMLPLLEDCLKNHMHKGSRFSFSIMLKIPNMTTQISLKKL